MKIDLGSPVWIGVTQGVVIAYVVEIESKSQEMIRLRDKGGHFHIRHILEIFATEREALRARVDQEKFWADRYLEQSYVCRENLSRLEQRLLRLETRRPIRPKRATSAPAEVAS